MPVGADAGVLDTVSSKGDGGQVNGNIEPLVDNEGALLATVLDQSHDCIKLLSLDGKIEYVNRQGAAAMELSSPSELVGASYLDRWPAEMRETIQEALAAAQQGERCRFVGSRPQPNGEPSWWDVAVSPVRTAAGTITHFVTIARDMTAETVERERVAAISLEMQHRLKNALTVASGIVMLSARGRPDVSAFANEIVTRFAQLGQVQAQILDPDADTRIPAIVPLIAEAYGKSAMLEFGELPDVRLPHRAMQALALSFGELATNSLKYGALRDGRAVRISGTMRDGAIELTWTEDTQFGAPRPGSQGLGLIERLVGTAGGSFRRDIEPHVMRAQIILPTA